MARSAWAPPVPLPDEAVPPPMPGDQRHRRLIRRFAVPLPFALAAACAGSPSAPPADGPPFEGVHVRIGYGAEAPTLDLAGAWLDPDGGGHGDGATAHVPESPPLVVTGDHTRWSLSDHTVVFTGHVRAERADVVLTSDTLTMTYTGDKVDRAVADGSVVVTRGDRRATADHGDLEVASGKISLTGHPALADGPHHLVGESIALFLDDDRLECDRCRLEVDGSALAPTPPAAPSPTSPSSP